MSSPSESPSYGACTACRAQKVRCILDLATNSSQCQRCTRLAKPCHFPPIYKRKQKVRTDIRVAELEKQMRGMRQELERKEAATQVESTGRSVGPVIPSELGHEDGIEPLNANPGNGSPTTSPGPGRIGASLWAGSSVAAGRAPTKDDRDVVERGIIDMATASQLCDIYRSELFSHLPLVVLDPSTSAEELRRTKPPLFLSIIAAAACKDHPQLSARLDQDLLHMYATHNVVNSEKSLEMIQALLISSVWFHPPNKFGQVSSFRATSTTRKLIKSR